MNSQRCLTKTQLDNGKAYSGGVNDKFQCGQGSNDDIPVTTLINCNCIRNKKISWVGAGGQFSVLASVHGDIKIGEDMVGNNIVKAEK
ncbi:hypothetical protein PAAG_11196 [Paracoccidioides lutzii Pb01]|uniref:Uncharacterized protein n=1 Tax=Paracoccidioides lutzii (strain ATCC MYA-826 / Pb01) TaxID=502779 RepID=A0A0A2V7D7_PARBA|nr:hypothetical protein PAAG_11196 [Paracoccidioides lutzii Pb01]KGQ02020.1 hypothetical protein PAAG_11196 [Paracoccidioides lutzii Pb01]